MERVGEMIVVLWNCYENGGLMVMGLSDCRFCAGTLRGEDANLEKGHAWVNGCGNIEMHDSSKYESVELPWVEYQMIASFYS